MKDFWNFFGQSKIAGLMLFYGLTIMSNPVKAVELYTMTAPCDLVLVDTETGTQSTIGNLGMSVEAMAFNAAGELYASVQPSICGVHGSAGHLARIDPLTANVTVIGSFGFGDVDAMAFRPDGKLYGVSASSDELFEVDLNTGAGMLVGSIGFPFIGGIEFLSNSLLVGADMTGGGGGLGTFISIDQSSGISTNVGAINFSTIEGMTLASDGLLYGLSDTLGGGSGAIVSIDPTTGAGTFVQTVSSLGFRDALAARKSFSETVPEPTSLLAIGIFGSSLFALRRQMK